MTMMLFETNKIRYLNNIETNIMKVLYVGINNIYF